MERFHLRAVCQVRPSHAQAGRSFSLPCSQSEYFRGVEIDDEIEFRWLLDPDMVASAPEQVRDVRSIRWRKRHWKRPGKKPKVPKFVRCWLSRKPPK